MFFINGVVLAIWATNIPELKRNLALTDQQLGFALSGFAAGTMITMYIAGILATKIGTRNTLVLGGILLSFTIPLCAYAPSYTTFVASILLLGVINSIYDVAMNSHACVIEIERKKSTYALFPCFI
ncbi:MFS transporter [Acinetobacter baumannii]|nr:MFS transporter [Acinetobacter baumannii]EJD6698902.1 MFS transporter [Acinetobacter baumannii]EKW2972816.1 MFS transporter [Acinetobacter baumannii]